MGLNCNFMIFFEKITWNFSVSIFFLSKKFLCVRKISQTLAVILRVLILRWSIKYAKLFIPNIWSSVSSINYDPNTRFFALNNLPLLVILSFNYSINSNNKYQSNNNSIDVLALENINTKSARWLKYCSCKHYGRPPLCRTTFWRTLFGRKK